MNRFNLKSPTNGQTQKTGDFYENHAISYLNKKGLQLIDRNYHCRFGEIDLIMKNHDTLIFIEVRYRKNNHFGSSAETVTKEKQRKIILTAQHYLQHNNLNLPCRFDVIAMQSSNNNHLLVNTEWIQSAFLI